MLLSDPRIQELLATKVVPCWVSVRDVPKVTVDLGDGRVLHRTITGNTVIHLCDRTGRVIDAFPGIYTPDAFLAELAPALALLDPDAAGPSDDRLRTFHQERFDGEVASEDRRITLSKSVIEAPLLTALGRHTFPIIKPIPAPAGLSRFEAATQRIVDASHPAAPPEVARSRGRSAIEEDSVNNQTVVRPLVHLYLSEAVLGRTPLECRDAFFVKLLKVPLHDPWLGLRDVLLPGTP